VQAPAAAQAAEVKKEEPKAQTSALVDVASINNALTSKDTEAQVAAMEKIGLKTLGDPAGAVQALDAGIVDNLVNIAKDGEENSKVAAMFTLAMLQKTQRDEVDRFNTAAGSQAIPPIALDQLVGFEKIAQVANDTTQNNEVRAAAVQALGYAVRPEDASVVRTTLEPVAKEVDANPLAQALQEVMAKVA
jgi:hypothetical protein